jgi:gliding motility-associated protein GldC
MKEEISRNSEIKINVGLTDSNIPLKIEWESDDTPGPDQGKHQAKAMLLSVFDQHTLETLKIDLWTKDMQIMEMDRFIYQTMRAMADTYLKATGNNQLANDMQKFTVYFGEKTGIIPAN